LWPLWPPPILSLIGVDAVELGEPGDRPSRDVHEGVGLGEDELRPAGAQPRLDDAGVRLVRLERLAAAAGELIDDELPDVVPRELVARAGIAEPHDQPRVCHVIHPAPARAASAAKPIAKTR